LNTTPLPPLLEVRGVSKAFPGVQALDNVDFEVYPGEVLALLGENGAGKSTLMKILSGAYHMDKGEIWLRGQQVTPQDPHHAQKLGISIIYQEFNLTPNQNVATNIFLGREPYEKGLGGLVRFVDRRSMRREAAKLLERVGARFSVDTLVGDLSVAEQQMVEIAKALSEKAEVIIMDEPTATLGEEEVNILFNLVHSLKAQGLAIIFITHRLEEIFRIADRVLIFRDGKRVGGMPIGEATPQKIISLMVGRPLEEVFQHSKHQKGDVILEVRGLTRRGAMEGDGFTTQRGMIKEVTFSLRRGEILGLAGLVGSGRTETVRTIFGADPLDAGEIFIEGKKVEFHTPEEAVKAGLALVPESRKTQGLMLIHDVERNIAVPNLDWLFPNHLVQPQRTRGLGQKYVERLNIRTPSLAQKVMFLSGGNQQKVVLAKWLAANPKVLILDEPTRGIDVGSKAEVHAIMNQLAQQGIGIIMISSEMPEILAMSDRIVVMWEGRVAGILDRAEATQERIMAYASGQLAETV
jgi:ribose transport system ATP-binding protein